MRNNLFKIDEALKSESENLSNLNCIEVNDVTLDVLDSYKRILKRQQEIIDEFRESKKKEQSVFDIADAISDGICVVDRNGIVKAINKGYTEITGIKENEVIDKHIQVLLSMGLFNNAVSLEVLEKRKKVTSLATINKINKRVLIVGNP